MSCGGISALPCHNGLIYCRAWVSGGLVGWPSCMAVFLCMKHLCVSMLCWPHEVTLPLSPGYLIMESQWSSSPMATSYPMTRGSEWRIQPRTIARIIAIIPRRPKTPNPPPPITGTLLSSWKPTPTSHPQTKPKLPRRPWKGPANSLCCQDAISKLGSHKTNPLSRPVSLLLFQIVLRALGSIVLTSSPSPSRTLRLSPAPSDSVVLIISRLIPYIPATILASSVTGDFISIPT